MSSQNAEIKQAIDSFDIDKARLLLRDALKSADAETYFLASLVALSDSQKRDFLEKALDKDPFHASAHRAMEALKSGSSGIKEPPRSEFSPSQPEPKPPVVAQQPGNPRFVIATVQRSASLHRFPWVNAPVRTTVNSGSDVVPLERTESGTWLNVLYIGSTGQEILGWIEAHNLDRLSLGDREVNLMDLPITEFNYNSRQDVIDLNTAIQRTQSVVIIPYLFFAMSLIIGVLVLIFSGGARRGSDATFVVICGIVAIGSLVWLIQMLGAVARKRTLHLGHSWRSIWQSRSKLDSIRRGKQSATENIMEDQAKIAAMQIAGNLANTYLSKSMTNKSEVTVRYR